MNEAARVLVRGRVQGVGFRYAARAEATRLGVVGWVRNLNDGNVETFVQGPRPAVEQMIDWCRHGPRLAEVTEVTAQWVIGEPPHERFHIR